MRTITLIALVLASALGTISCGSSKADKPGWTQLRDNAKDGDMVVNSTGQLIGRVTQTMLSNDPGGRQFLEIRYYIASNGAGFRIISNDDYPGSWYLVKPGTDIGVTYGRRVSWGELAAEFNGRHPEDGDKYYDFAEPKTR